MTEVKFKQFVETLKDMFGDCVDCPYLRSEEDRFEGEANIYLRGNKYTGEGKQNAAMAVIRVAIVTNLNNEKEFKFLTFALKSLSSNSYILIPKLCDYISKLLTSPRVNKSSDFFVITQNLLTPKKKRF